METNHLINRIKSEDERYARICKSFQIVYWVLVPIYLVLIIRDIITNSPVTEIAAGFCFLLGMIVFILIFRLYYLEYKSIDYAQSTLEMLKKAAHRYKPLQSKLWLVLAAVLLMDAGLSLRSPFEEFAHFQIIYCSSMIVAVIVGLIIWRIRYKPLRDDALQMVREIEEGGGVVNTD